MKNENLNYINTEFETLSISNIDTYIINSDLASCNSIWSIFTIANDANLTNTDVIKRIVKKKVLLFDLHCENEEEIFENREIEYNRNIEISMKTNNIRKPKYFINTVIPCNEEAVAQTIMKIQEKYNSHTQQLANKKEVIYNLKESLGKFSFDFKIDFNNIDKFIWLSTNIIFFKYQEKFYHIEFDFGSGHLDDIVYFGDKNLTTFENKRFSYYPYEFRMFLPKLKEEEKYLKYLNHFLFDQEKRNIIVLTEKESEYKGIKNSLYKLAESELQLSNEIYKSIFKMPITFEKKCLNRSNNFNIELVQAIETNYEISYNYGAVLVENVMYVIFWDNY